MTLLCWLNLTSISRMPVLGTLTTQKHLRQTASNIDIQKIFPVSIRLHLDYLIVKNNPYQTLYHPYEGGALLYVFRRLQIMYCTFKN